MILRHSKLVAQSRSARGRIARPRDVDPKEISGARQATGLCQALELCKAILSRTHLHFASFL